MSIDPDNSFDISLTVCDNYTFSEPIWANMQLDCLDASCTTLSTFESKVGLLKVDGIASEGTKTEWLCRPFISHRHDLDLLKELSDVFMENIKTPFVSFLGFGSNTGEIVQPEEMLAIAAVGALFSGVDGGIRVANALYDEASRMLMAVVST